MVPSELETALMAAVGALTAAVGWLWKDSKKESAMERRRWQDTVAKYEMEKSELLAELTRERELFRSQTDAMRSELSVERSRLASAERKHYQDVMLFLSALAKKRGSSLESILLQLRDQEEAVRRE